MSYGRFVNKKRICASFCQYCLKKQATTLRRRRVETELSQSKKWRILEKWLMYILREPSELLQQSVDPPMSRTGAKGRVPTKLRARK